MISFILKWPNRLIAFFFDIGMISFAWFGAYWLYCNLHQIPTDILKQAVASFFPVVFLQASTFWLFGLYRGVWRYASIPDLIRIIKAVGTGTIGILILFFFIKSSFDLPRVVPVLYALLLVFSLTGPRAIFRWLKNYQRFFHDCERILIVGAGSAGEGLVRDLFRHSNHLYQPIVIVDDNPMKLGRDIHGVRVVDTFSKIPSIVKQYRIDLILIAIPSASSVEMRRVVNLCEQTNLPFRTLPGINDFASGRVDIKLIRNVSLEDLLGRDQIQLDWESIGKDLQRKTILISGGGGSIGTELCRQIAPLGPKKLIIVDKCEYNLYAIDMELRKKFPNLASQCILLDITDRIGVQQIFNTHRPDMVFHAAAYKHVPLLETQSRVAVHNNVLGTNTLAKAAVIYDVKKFILISTTKAVNPTNLMGATKRAAEMICQNLNDQFATSFITVRFGNVFDSAGSVVPLFRKQIQEGGPLTVTHPDITRYFMSIPEAAQLILQASLLAKGGEIFVLDMGEPIKISYLAEQMVKLAGKTVGRDIDIVYTGLRPGEKLHEELFYENEELQKTIHNKIMLANAHSVDKNFINIVDKMEKAYLKTDDDSLNLLLSQLVPEYKSQAIMKKGLHLAASS